MQPGDGFGGQSDRLPRPAGVTRLSFGAQSMVPHVLESLGREHGPARSTGPPTGGEAGFAGAYNVDLIFGAAGETMGDWRVSLETVLGLDPPPAHISAYALTVEPGTPLAGEPTRHPLDEDQADKYLSPALCWPTPVLSGTSSRLGSAGGRCRHNLLYWAQGEYLGVGCAAHSHLASPDGSAKRWWNVRTPERYCHLVDDKAVVRSGRGDPAALRPAGRRGPGPEPEDGGGRAC